MSSTGLACGAGEWTPLGQAQGSPAGQPTRCRLVMLTLLIRALRSILFLLLAHQLRD